MDCEPSSRTPTNRVIGESVSPHTPQALVELFRDAGIEGESRMGTGDSYRFFGVRM
jgi:hypothetical protein